jgi:hypothetical protein
MLLEAAETIIRCFGFDKTLYDAKAIRKNNNKKWWHELAEERSGDIETERNVHAG